MIRTRDSLRLSLTKLSTRKIRLSISIIVCVLMFGVLFLSTLLLTGIIDFQQKFAKNSISEKYFLSYSNMSYPSFGSRKMKEFVSSQDNINKAQAKYNELISQKKEEARKLGIYFDPSQEVPVIISNKEAPGAYNDLDPDAKILNANSAIASSIIVDSIKADESNKTDTLLKGIRDRYQGLDLYINQNIVTNNSAFTNKNEQINIIYNDKELGLNNESHISYGDIKAEDMLKVFQSEWKQTSSTLLSSFLLPGQNLNIDDSGQLPVVIPISVAQKLLGLPVLGAKASPQEYKQRISDIRKGIAGFKLNACYRNGTALANLEKARAIQADINANKTTPNYQKPALIWDIGKQPCQDIVVVSDTRDRDTTIYDNKL